MRFNLFVLLVLSGILCFTQTLAGAFKVAGIVADTVFTDMERNFYAAGNPNGNSKHSSDTTGYTYFIRKYALAAVCYGRSNFRQPNT